MSLPVIAARQLPVAAAGVALPFAVPAGSACAAGAGR